MAGWNGSGTFERVHDWTDDEGNAIDITASRFDDENDTIAAGINNCLTKDGQNAATADINFGTNKLLAVKDATLRTDGANVGQIQDNKYKFATAGGSANAITVAPAVGPSAYVNGQVFLFEASATNTGATTININSVGAKDVIDHAGNALVGGEIVSGRYYAVVYDDTADDFRLLTVHSLTKQAGKETIPIQASSFLSAVTNGATLAQEETSTNKVNTQYYAFDDSTQEYISVVIPMPKSYNNGPITAQFIWKCGATSGNVIWGIQGVALSDDDALDTAFGNAVEVTDGAGSAADDVMTSSETSAMTIAGNPAAGDLVVLRVYRKAPDAGDTLSGDAKFLAARLFFTTNKANDA